MDCPWIALNVQVVPIGLAAKVTTTLQLLLVSVSYSYTVRLSKLNTSAKRMSDEYNRSHRYGESGALVAWR